MSLNNHCDILIVAEIRGEEGEGPSEGMRSPGDSTGEECMGEGLSGRAGSAGWRRPGVLYGAVWPEREVNVYRRGPGRKSDTHGQSPPSVI